MLERRVWKVTKGLIYGTVHSGILRLSSRAVFFSTSLQNPFTSPSGVKYAFYVRQLCLTCELLSSLGSTNTVANCSPALQLLLLLCLLIIILAVALSLRTGNDAKGRSPLIIILQPWFCWNVFKISPAWLASSIYTHSSLIPKKVRK